MIQKHKKLIVFTLIFSFLLLGTGVFINKNSEAQASDGEMLTMLRGMNQVLGLIAERLTVFNVKDGNVGIGTTDQEVQLEVMGQMTIQQPGCCARVGFKRYDDLKGHIGTDYNALTLMTKGGNHLRAISRSNGPENDVLGLFQHGTSGNVGIGTTNPQEELHVAGNLKVDGNIIGGSPVKIAEGLRVEGEFCLEDICVTREQFKAVFGDL